MSPAVRTILEKLLSETLKVCPATSSPYLPLLAYLFPLSIISFLYTFVASSSISLNEYQQPLISHSRCIGNIQK
jgi:hypothetical protein